MSQGFTNPKGYMVATGVSAGSYGDASHVGTFTVDANGRLTAAASVAIALDASAITTGTLAVARGGTNIGSYTAGDTIYATGSTTLTKLAGNSTATKQFLSMTSSVPSWGVLANTDMQQNWAIPAQVVSLTNISVASAPASIDGNNTSGMRVLLIGQTSTSENGIWIYNGSGNAMTRPTDYPSGGTTQAYFGLTVFVRSGNSGVAGISRFFWITTTGAITIDTTGTSWSGSNVNLNSPVGTLVATNGGTGFASYSTGDLLVGSGSTIVKLSISGTTGAVLAVSGGTATWQTSLLVQATSVSASVPVSITGPTGTSASAAAFLVTGSTLSAQAGPSEYSDVNFNLSRTVTFVGGSFTTNRAVLFQPPTYASASTSTLTNAATVAISGAPANGANLTITNKYAFWVQAGTTQLDGGTVLTNSANGVTNAVQIAPVVRSGAVALAGLLFTGPAHTNLTAIESSDVTFGLNRTVQFANATIATQRAFVINAPTYAFVSAGTITTAATLAIQGAPAAGSGATLTNTYSFWIQGGKFKSDDITDASGASTSGAVVVGDGTAAGSVSIGAGNVNIGGALKIGTALAATYGGTGVATPATGVFLYGSGGATMSSLAANSTSTLKILTMTSSVPSWTTTLSYASILATIVTHTVATLSVTSATDLLLCDSSSITAGFQTATLPTAVGIAGRVIYIMKIDRSTIPTQIKGTSSQTFNGAPSIMLTEQWQKAAVFSDGSNWLVF